MRYRRAAQRSIVTGKSVATSACIGGADCVCCPPTRPGEGATTTEEYDETYKSLVALEPYKLDAVVKGTTSPESLTLVRKGRGVEHHKGNAMLVPGSDADRCLVTWLANAIDTEACTRAKAP